MFKTYQKTAASAAAANKRKLLIIAGVIAILLIFTAFLMLLSSDTPAPRQDTLQPPVAESEDLPQPDIPRDQVPTSQRSGYDTADQGIADLLDGPELPPAAPPSPADNPFANMNTNAPAARSESQPAAPAVVPEPAPAPVQPAPVQPVQPAPAVPAAPAASGGFLYCAAFDRATEADAQKARLAFQGVVSTVISNNEGKYTLRIGSFKTRDQARAKFSELGDRGLVSRCALTGN